VSAEQTATADPDAQDADGVPVEGDEDDAHHAIAQAREPASPEPASTAEARRRMLAARRRLLLMLIGLEIAAVALAALSLAAIWVVIPPTIMLVGYLLLLREAAQADAERAQHEEEAAARARDRSRAGLQARHAPQAHRDTPVEGTSTEGIPAAAAALAAKFAAAPVPADYEDAGPGRDFAPGLAGKYTTSNADADTSADTADDDYYEPYKPYEPPRLRAVGD
jgi:hypothetical protein